jgi:hypothetical protein
MVFASAQVTFPALSIAAFADPTFDADFRRLYKQQMAASAGVQPKDVVIESIRAGSVAVQVGALLIGIARVVDQRSHHRETQAGLRGIDVEGLPGETNAD